MSKRALRRHHKERMKKRAKKLLRNISFYDIYPQPHKYFAYNLENSDDFLDFLKVDVNPGGPPLIWIEGQGCINKGTYIDWPFNQEFELYVPPYNHEEVEKNLESAAKVRGDTYTVCSCWICGNPRKKHNEPHLNERRAAYGLKEEFEEYGFHPKTRQLKKFGGWW